ncbi:hypothetical protein QIA37_05215 (plasmid) [Borrelia sp. CA_690]|uniref:hypothetical protein n=1 Tax=Borrelia TaxID=138 RepID=UPI001E2E6BB5|nr:hypothetical protein [Borrelia maritima]
MQNKPNKTSNQEDQNGLKITNNKRKGHKKLSQVVQQHQEIEKAKFNVKTDSGISYSNRNIYNSIPEVKEEIISEITEEVIISRITIPEIFKEVVTNP